MIKGIMYDSKAVDTRHTVDIHNSISFATAIQVNNDGTYESVMYMVDDMRTWGNEVIIDATEEEKELYRKYLRKFITGDKVIVNRGRKMVGEIKEVASQYRYTVDGTYGHVYTDYLVFTDGTKVNKLHCDFI